MLPLSFVAISPAADLGLALSTASVVHTVSLPCIIPTRTRSRMGSLHYASVLDAFNVSTNPQWRGRSAEFKISKGLVCPFINSSGCFDQESVATVTVSRDKCPPLFTVQTIVDTGIFCLVSDYVPMCRSVSDPPTSHFLCTRCTRIPCLYLGAC